MQGIPSIQYTDELEKNINHRCKAYKASKNSLIEFNGNSDDSCDDKLGGACSKEKTKSIYCRSSEYEKVNLEDF